MSWAGLQAILQAAAAGLELRPGADLQALVDEAAAAGRPCRSPEGAAWLLTEPLLLPKSTELEGAVLVMGSEAGHICAVGGAVLSGCRFIGGLEGS